MSWNVTSDCLLAMGLDENAANSVVNSSIGVIAGTSRAGTTAINTNTISTTGKVNLAFTFNGATNNRNIRLSNLLNYAYNSPFSAEAWIQSTATGEQSIVGNFDNDSSQNGWLFQVDDNHIDFIFSYNIGG